MVVLKNILNKVIRCRNFFVFWIIMLKRTCMYKNVTRGERFIGVEYTYFPKALFAIMQTIFALEPSVLNVIELG